MTLESLSLSCPISCLQYLNDGTLLSGYGPYLSGYKIFSDSARIHRIVQHPNHKGCLLIGGREARLVEYHGNRLQREICQLKTLDWVLDGCFILEEKQICLITANFSLQFYLLDDSNQLLNPIKVIQCPKHSLLWVAKFSEAAYPSLSSMLIAGGTILSEILIWRPMLPKDNLFTIKAHNGSIFDVSFSPDHRYLASVSDDRSLIVHAFPAIKGSEEIVSSPPHWGHTSRVWQVRWLSERQIVTSGEDNQVILWTRGDSGGWTMESKTEVHEGRGIWALSTFKTIWAAGGSDGAVIEWLTRDESLLQKDVQAVQGVCVGELENSIVVAKSGKVYVSKLGEDLRLVYENTKLQGGFCLQVCGNWGVVCPSNTVNATLVVMNFEELNSPTLYETSFYVSSLHLQTLHEGSERLVIYDRRSNNIYIGDLKSSQPMSQFETICSPFIVTTLRFSPTGDLWAGSRDGSVAILTQGSSQLVYKRHMGGVRDIFFDEGNTISVGRDGIVAFSEERKIKLRRGGWIEQILSATEYVVWGEFGCEVVHVNGQTLGRFKYHGNQPPSWQVHRVDCRVFKLYYVQHSKLFIETMHTLTIQQRGMHGREIRSLALFTRNVDDRAHYLASVSESGVVLLSHIDDNTGSMSTLFRTCELMQGAGKSVVFHDGWLIFGGNRGMIQCARVWEDGSGLWEEEDNKWSTNGEERVMDLSISPSGKMLVGYSDGMVRMFHFDSGDGRFKLLRQWKAHLNAVLQVCIGMFLITSSSAGEIAIWDDTGMQVWKNQVLSAGIDVMNTWESSQSTFKIAVAGDSGEFKLLEFDSRGIELWRTQEPRAHGAAIHGLKFVTDIDILTCSIDQRISLWRLKEDKSGFDLIQQSMINVADCGDMELTVNGNSCMAVIGGVGLEVIQFTLDVTI